MQLSLYSSQTLFSLTSHRTWKLEENAILALSEDEKIHLSTHLN